MLTYIVFCFSLECVRACTYVCYKGAGIQTWFSALFLTVKQFLQSLGTFIFVHLSMLGENEGIELSLMEETVSVSWYAVLETCVFSLLPELGGLDPCLQHAVLINNPDAWVFPASVQSSECVTGGTEEAL